jgi:hypothetical protein
LLNKAYTIEIQRRETAESLSQHQKSLEIYRGYFGQIQNGFALLRKHEAVIPEVYTAEFKTSLSSEDFMLSTDIEVRVLYGAFREFLKENFEGDYRKFNDYVAPFYQDKIRIDGGDPRPWKFTNTPEYLEVLFENDMEQYAFLSFLREMHAFPYYASGGADHDVRNGFIQDSYLNTFKNTDAATKLAGCIKPYYTQYMFLAKNISDIAIFCEDLSLNYILEHCVIKAWNHNHKNEQIPEAPLDVLSLMSKDDIERCVLYFTAAVPKLRLVSSQIDAEHNPGSDLKKIEPIYICITDDMHVIRNATVRVSTRSEHHHDGHNGSPKHEITFIPQHIGGQRATGLEDPNGSSLSDIKKLHPRIKTYYLFKAVGSNAGLGHEAAYETVSDIKERNVQAAYKECLENFKMHVIGAFIEQKLRSDVNPDDIQRSVDTIRDFFCSRDRVILNASSFNDFSSFFSLLTESPGFSSELSNSLVPALPRTMKQVMSLHETHPRFVKFIGELFDAAGDYASNKIRSSTQDDFSNFAASVNKVDALQEIVLDLLSSFSEQDLCAYLKLKNSYFQCIQEGSNSLSDIDSRKRYLNCILQEAQTHSLQAPSFDIHVFQTRILPFAESQEQFQKFIEQLDRSLNSYIGDLLYQQYLSEKNEDSIGERGERLGELIKAKDQAAFYTTKFGNTLMGFFNSVINPNEQVVPPRELYNILSNHSTTVYAKTLIERTNGTTEGCATYANAVMTSYEALFNEFNQNPSSLQFEFNKDLFFQLANIDPKEQDEYIHTLTCSAQSWSISYDAIISYQKSDPLDPAGSIYQLHMHNRNLRALLFLRQASSDLFNILGDQLQ